MKKTGFFFYKYKLGSNRLSTDLRNCQSAQCTSGIKSLVPAITALKTNYMESDQKY